MVKLAGCVQTGLVPSGANGVGWVQMEAKRGSSSRLLVCVISAVSAQGPGGRLPAERGSDRLGRPHPNWGWRRVGEPDIRCAEMVADYMGESLARPRNRARGMIIMHVCFACILRTIEMRGSDSEPILKIGGLAAH